MPEPFAVNTADLDRAVEEMAAYAAYVEDTVSRINTMVDNLHIQWRGEAAKAHVAAHQKWSHGEQVMREVLGHLKTIGTDVSGNYTRAAEINTTMWT